jgi:hypothetical protein
LERPKNYTKLVKLTVGAAPPRLRRDCCPRLAAPAIFEAPLSLGIVTLHQGQSGPAVLMWSLVASLVNDMCLDAGKLVKLGYARWR